MSVASTKNAVTFTATGDAIDFGPTPRKLAGLTFQGTGLTAGNRLVVRDTAVAGSGNQLADYLIEGTTDNADLWAGRRAQTVSGLAIDTGTIAGTWVLTATVFV